MKRRVVRIDFARPSLRRTLFQTPRWAWSFAVAGLALCAGATFAGWRYERASTAYEAELARLRAHASAPPVTQVAQVAQRRPQVAQAQVDAVNVTIMQLNLPWRALHDAVQAATPPTVALLSLEPDAKKHTLRITAETKGSDDMVDYVRSLQEQPGFAGVTLVRHEINDQDANHPIRFQVDAKWRGE